MAPPRAWRWRGQPGHRPVRTGPHQDPVPRPAEAAGPGGSAFQHRPRAVLRHRAAGSAGWSHWPGPTRATWPPMSRACATSACAPTWSTACRSRFAPAGGKSSSSPCIPAPGCSPQCGWPAAHHTRTLQNLPAGDTRPPPWRSSRPPPIRAPAPAFIPTAAALHRAAGGQRRQRLRSRRAGGDGCRSIRCASTTAASWPGRGARGRGRHARDAPARDLDGERRAGQLLESFGPGGDCLPRGRWQRPPGFGGRLRAAFRPIATRTGTRCARSPPTPCPSCGRSAGRWRSPPTTRSRWSTATRRFTPGSIAEAAEQPGLVQPGAGDRGGGPPDQPAARAAGAAGAAARIGPAGRRCRPPGPAASRCRSANAGTSPSRPSGCRSC